MIGHAVYKYGGEVEGHYCNIFGHIIYCNLVCGTDINKNCPYKDKTASGYAWLDLTSVWDSYL